MSTDACWIGHFGIEPRIFASNHVFWCRTMHVSVEPGSLVWNECYNVFYQSSVRCGLKTNHIYCCICSILHSTTFFGKLTTFGVVVSTLDTLEISWIICNKDVVSAWKIPWGKIKWKRASFPPMHIPRDMLPLDFGHCCQVLASHFDTQAELIFGFLETVSFLLFKFYLHTDLLKPINHL